MRRVGGEGSKVSVPSSGPASSGAGARRQCLRTVNQAPPRTLPRARADNRDGVIRPGGRARPRWRPSKATPLAPRRGRKESPAPSIALSGHHERGLKLAGAGPLHDAVVAGAVVQGRKQQARIEAVDVVPFSMVLDATGRLRSRRVASGPGRRRRSARHEWVSTSSPTARLAKSRKYMARMV